MNYSTESPQAVGFSSERLARIRPVMQSYIEDHGFAGFSTMLARRGRVVHFEQVGQMRRLRRSIAATGRRCGSQADYGRSVFCFKRREDGIGPPFVDAYRNGRGPDEDNP